MFCTVLSQHRTPFRPLKMIRYFSSSTFRPATKQVLPTTPNATEALRSSKALPAGTIGSRLGPVQQLKLHNARKLFDTGRTKLYRAPSQFTFLATSYFLGSASIISAIYMGKLGHWKYDPHSGLPWFVNVAYRAVMPILTFLGGFVIIRTFRFIRAIDLIKAGDQLKISITVRNAVPFLRAKKYTTEPYQFLIDRRVVRPMQAPSIITSATTPNTSVVTTVGRGISKAFYYPFAATRKVFTHEGIMNVNLEEPSIKALKMDMDGEFSNNGRDLLDIATVAD